MSDTVEHGIITSKRKILTVGGSKCVSLSAKWLDIQRWLGKDVSEVVSVANSVVVLAPPEKEEHAKRVLKMFEHENLTAPTTEFSGRRTTPLAIRSAPTIEGPGEEESSHDLPSRQVSPTTTAKRRGGDQ